jgi:hypothetical protein
LQIALSEPGPQVRAELNPFIQRTMIQLGFDFLLEIVSGDQLGEHWRDWAFEQISDKLGIAKLDELSRSQICRQLFPKIRSFWWRGKRHPEFAAEGRADIIHLCDSVAEVYRLSSGQVAVMTETELSLELNRQAQFIKHELAALPLDVLRAMYEKVYGSLNRSEELLDRMPQCLMPFVAALDDEKLLRLSNLIDGECSSKYLVRGIKSPEFVFNVSLSGSGWTQHYAHDLLHYHEAFEELRNTKETEIAAKDTRTPAEEEWLDWTRALKETCSHCRDLT